MKKTLICIYLTIIIITQCENAFAVSVPKLYVIDLKKDVGATTWLYIQRGFDEAYFKSLTAEVKIIDRSGKSKQSKVIWKQIRDRNEGLDCMNYAIAAREIFARLSLNQLATLTKEELSLISRGIDISDAKEKIKFKNQKGIEI